MHIKHVFELASLKIYGIVPHPFFAVRNAQHRKSRTYQLNFISFQKSNNNLPCVQNFKS